MGKLLVFNMLSLDGYFVDMKGDMSWAHADRNDEEWNNFVSGNARSGGTLVFGRITYELMASWWPTKAAAEMDPVVAERMNALPKLVFSRTMDKAEWSNTRLVREGLGREIRKQKAEGVDMAVMGSGSLVAQLAEESLVDEYQFVMIPIVLGSGRTLFGGLTKRMSLKLVNSRTFRNGNVLVCYEPKP
jgi:dihydrofolate reductase